MKHLLASLMALAVLIGATPAEARARVEQLRPERGAAFRSCTGDRVWCITRTRDSVTVLYRGDRGQRDVARLPLPSNADERLESALWPAIVRVTRPGRREFVLVGVLRTQSEMYSGGGGSLTRLDLFEIAADGAAPPRPVLEAPWASSFMIRACFTREDERARRGACHDQYRYRAALTAPPQGPNEMRLTYRSRADSYPGRRSRSRDSNREPALRRSDLVRATDPLCTFERTLARNPATGAFMWNAPLPPCSDYLELQ